MNVYEMISSADFRKDVFLATVVSGKEIGAKALFEGRRMRWSSSENGPLHEYSRKLAQAEPGLTEIAGTEFFIEKIRQHPHLIICGGGHISMPLITMGKMLGMWTTVLEDRLKYAGDARRQGADKVICDAYEQALPRIDSDADTYFVIVTRGHQYDLDCLRCIISKEHAYIGMIGSHRRVSMARRRLLEEGVPQEMLDAVRAPIGLRIGAETPEEIAVAIMAEIIAVSKEKNPGHGISREILQVISEKNREPVISAVIIRRKGSAPREAGARMLIRRDGTVIGTIGGGCMEAAVIRRAREMLLTGAAGAEVQHVDLTASEAAEEGMVCGGAIDVLLEAV